MNLKSMFLAAAMAASGYKITRRYPMAKTGSWDYGGNQTGVIADTPAVPESPIYQQRP